MERKEFIKQACGIGFCSCVAATMLAPTRLARAEEPKPEAKPPKPAEDWRVPFVQQRYAALLGALTERVDGPALDAALEEQGRFCARSSNMAAPFAGNIEGFLANLRDRWKATAEHDAGHGTVRLAFPEMPDCACAFMHKGLTPGKACQCSIGWQKQAFSTVLGRPVQVELKSSILRGGRQCVFEIRTA